ncbi:Phosphatidylinositol transfer protein CSR1 [Porphyridium purpureum]|uniref:Phosphatidylinositol transfer protein CSR1 n=1 Tax=Porphyridium purpureum TaxID=35688 RepID=A0A5J4YL88_PORPP|nr:Phosphatidylinositol transfer protein CSR1 [Porphyridium purpureum]|eukprot:POR2566..scf249_10
MSWTPKILSRGHTRSNSLAKNADGTVVLSSERTLEVEEAALAELRVKADGFVASSARFSALRDEDLHRFLRARHYDVDLAFALLQTSEKWTVANTPVDAENIVDEIRSGLGWICGYDKVGRAVLYVDVEHYDKNKRNLERTTQLAIYMIMLAIQKSQKHGHEQITIVFDLFFFGLKTMDQSMVKSLLQLLSDAFPERLAKLHIVRAPSIFKGFWSIISPWVDQGTAAKIDFDSAGALTAHIDKDQLPTQLDGPQDFKAFLATLNI